MYIYGEYFNDARRPSHNGDDGEEETARRQVDEWKTQVSLDRRREEIIRSGIFPGPSDLWCV